MIVYLLSGLLLGFISSGHCLGMCGPIAFSVGAAQTGGAPSALQKIKLFLLVGFGKALAYAMIGLVFGGLGFLVADWSAFLGFSKALPWITGGLFILVGLGIAGLIPRFEIVLKKIENLLTKYFSAFFNQKLDAGSHCAMGFFWGFLPCPMVLVPALGAAVSGSLSGFEGALKGFFMMFGFGLGTIPALYAGAFAGSFFARLKKWSTLLVGFALIVLGVLTIFYSQILMDSMHHHPH